MFDTFSQVAIFVLGTVAIVLVAKKNKWGFVAGFMSQPFWFISSYKNEQWGVFFLSFIYAASWSYGIYEWFFKKNSQKLE